MRRLVIASLILLGSLFGVVGTVSASGLKCNPPVGSYWTQYCAVYGPQGSYTQQYQSTYGKGGLYCQLYGYNC